MPVMKPTFKRSCIISSSRAQNCVPLRASGPLLALEPAPQMDVNMSDPVDKLKALTNLTGLTAQQKAVRVTIWHRVERRKIAGNASPLRRNLAKYLRKNPQCDAFIGQGKSCEQQVGEIDPRTGRVVTSIGRVAIWNRRTKVKTTGNATPLPKNLATFFAKNPDCEIYRGQDLDQEPSFSFPNDLYSASDIDGGIHYPFATVTNEHSETETVWKPLVDRTAKTYIFHETHEIVPDDYWTNHRKVKCDPVAPVTTPNPTAMSSKPIKLGTCKHELRNLEGMKYEDMASSWSNAPMWNDSTWDHKLEQPIESSITALQAGTSLAWEGFNTDDSYEPKLQFLHAQDMKYDAPASRLGKFENRRAEEDSSGLIFSLEDYLVDDPGENMEISTL